MALSCAFPLPVDHTPWSTWISLGYRRWPCTLARVVPFRRLSPISLEYCSGVEHRALGLFPSGTPVIALSIAWYHCAPTATSTNAMNDLAHLLAVHLGPACFLLSADLPHLVRAGTVSLLDFCDIFRLFRIALEVYCIAY